MQRRWMGVLGVLVAFGLAGCQSDWRERYEQSQQENLELTSQMEELRSSNAQTVAQNESANAQMKALEREQQRLAKERDDAAQRAQEWKKQAEEAAQRSAAAPASTAPAASAATERVRSDLERTYPGAVFVNDDGNVEIRLSSDVTFGSGKDELSDSAKRTLKSLAPKLNGEFAQYAIRIEGHTDNQPVVRTKDKYGDNLGLSTARANSVTRFMREEMKIDPRRLTSAGRGEQMPIADNGTAAGRSKNRRVEIVVVTSVQAR